MAPSTSISLLRNILADLFITLRSLLKASLSGLACARLLGLMIGMVILALGNAAVALQKGDEGDAVTDLQNRLTSAQCYDGPISGYFGDLTEAGVIRCQTQYGLDPDGVAGPQTLAVLGGAVIEPQPPVATNALTTQNRPQSTPPQAEARLQIGDRNEAVTTLQQQLAQLGFYSGSIDGIFGPQTQAAVQQLQRTVSLPEDGMVGSKEQAALVAALGQQATQPIDRAPAAQPTYIQLAKGDQNKAVGELQQRLKALGWFQSQVTAYYGDITQTAVADFQRTQGLPVTGIADAQTLEALAIVNLQPSQSVQPSQPAQPFKAANSPFTQGDFTTSSSRTPLNRPLFPVQSPKTQVVRTQPAPTAAKQQPRRYIVVIPIQSGTTLSQVRQIWNNASPVKNNRKGAYIQAGTFTQRSEADRQSQLLRAYGLDARVDYQ
ncbi:peptidoglycan-binding protein [Alkalinema sp. FACHB-956]|uniref:peptidoglycan-binding domain-containing protein n=1 Tax=Alkalinema sp. FACHB-956 TaxID=2692768 RepID=UPI00168897FE|nr:peptidoglycan-binding protein [Alkalinema sp. FACHB-956]MBD2326580.1 peptidoglycan-binding protein [Alkalinema sp. FACHB-956]